MVVIALQDYDTEWPARFDELGTALRYAVGERALAIHHIGSTAVPGLAAKPVIDVQVTVDARHERLVHDLERVGYVWLRDNDDRRKWFFRRERPLLSNCHVRVWGCPSQAQALLFRDYLRSEPSARDRYALAKLELAAREWPTVDDYADAKGDIVWQLLREADRWSWGGWTQSPGDA